MNITDREIYRTFAMRNAIIGILSFAILILAVAMDSSESITLNKFEKIGLIMLAGYMASALALAVLSCINASIPKPKSIRTHVSFAAKVSKLGIVVSSFMPAFIIVPIVFPPEGQAATNTAEDHLMLASFSVAAIIVSLLVRNAAMAMVSMYLNNTAPDV